MVAAPPKTFTLAPFEYAEARALMDGLGLAEPVAVTLVRRGYRTVAAARAFLAAADRHDPFAFADMASVVERLRSAAGERKRITVHGDYDVDGVCSTAILVRALRRLGAECDWLLPDRLGEGYGLTAQTVATLAARGTRVLLTADCGIGSVAEVELAKEAGLEVIVTDHHQPGTELPACPILHPTVSGYPFAELCATGVAYKLAAALHGEAVADEDLDLVALATVADLVPLRGENRALVRRGLAELRRARRPGIRALVAAAGVVAERLDEGDLAFRLGPRINAAGRLYRADAAVELILTESEDRAIGIAKELDRFNQERRSVEEEVSRDAEAALAELPGELREAPGVVIGGQGWHPGVVGIAASRLVEKLWKPVVLVAFGADGRGRGSGRSIPGFDLLTALDACAEHLDRHGGHRAAAGVELHRGSLERFQAAFAAAAAAAMPDAPVRTEAVDAIVGTEMLGHETAEQLERLGPFGNGNPAVRLLVPGARLDDVRPMGDGARHARFSLRSAYGRALGVAFGVNGSLDGIAEPLDVAVRLELNAWNGSVEPRVVLGGLFRDESVDTAPAAAEPIPEAEFWRRFDAELGASPEESGLDGGYAVRRAECRGTSAVVTIAALASSGATVLAICADAHRRRDLVTRAARPARFGGGATEVACGRDPESAISRVDRVGATGSGTVLVDWELLERDPGLASRFDHVVLVDPAPSARMERVAQEGRGFLHLAYGQPEVEFALRCHADAWPSRASLGEAYRALADASRSGPISADRARVLLCGETRSFPRSPEAAARQARVLTELGLLEWEGFGVNRTLRVVSSKGTELERSHAYRAYRRRFEEGRRWLTRRTPKPT